MRSAFTKKRGTLRGMNIAITLEWTEAGRVRLATISHPQPSKNPGTVRLGRDPARCDIVLAHPTVSGLHVEIFFNSQQNSFWVRNLRDSNPPFADNRRLTRGELPLNLGSILVLGEVKIKVAAVSLADPSLAPTVLLPPQPAPQPPIAPTKPPDVTYGLECPHCGRISPYERLDLGCPWCGTSLAAAASVVMPASGSQATS